MTPVEETLTITESCRQTQLGFIPKGWSRLSFVSYLDPARVPSRPSVPSEEYQECGRFPVVDQGARFVAGWTDREECVLFEPLPVVVFGDHTRSLKLINFPFAVGADGTKVLRPNLDLVEPEFLYFALRNLHIPSRGYNRHFRYLRESSIAAPESKREQRAIAQALGAVQETVEARRRELALERERKAALMQHLFTHGTRNEARKQTEIGEVPESWEVVPFAKLVDIAQGQVDPRVEPYSSMVHVGPDNIEPGTGRLTASKTAAELNFISGKYLFGTEHVLYSKIRPYLRKAAVPGFEGVCSADMYPLYPQPDRLVRGFLFQLLLTTQFTTSASAAQDRTGIPKINRNQLRAIRLPQPPLSEQQEIAELLGACDAKTVTLEREITVTEELFRAMLEELMTGRLRAKGLIEEMVG